MTDKHFSNQNIEGIVAHSYVRYTFDIQCKSFSFDGIPVEWKTKPFVDGKDATFFHLITVQYKNRDQYCCPDQSITCDRDFYYNPMMSDEYVLEKKRSICGFRIIHMLTLLDVFNKKDNLIWKKRVHGSGGVKDRFYILDQEHKYFVVLQQNNNGTIVLWTAYPISSDKVKDLKRDYKKNKDGIRHTLSVK